jgi:hypothetical protein
MPTKVNDIRGLATRTSGGRELAAKKMSDQIEYSDNLNVAAHFALTGLSALWLTDRSLGKVVDVAGKLLKMVRFTRYEDVARKAA